MIILLTGQPNSGKTTLGKALQDLFVRSGVYAILIDGDKLREMTHNYDYSEDGRMRNMRDAFAIAMALDDTAGKTMVIIALVAPYRAMRESLKEFGGVIECYLHTSRVHAIKDKRRPVYEPPVENYVDVDSDFPLERSIKTVIDAVVHEPTYSKTTLIRGGL